MDSHCGRGIVVGGWKGLVREYGDWLDLRGVTDVVTLLEGNTPLLHAERLSERVGADVWLKLEGLNPTGSFKDRGMTMAITKAKSAGATTVVCGSTGNTSAAAAAYAARAVPTYAVCNSRSNARSASSRTYAGMPAVSPEAASPSNAAGRLQSMNVRGMRLRKRSAVRLGSRASTSSAVFRPYAHAPTSVFTQKNSSSDAGSAPFIRARSAS